MDCFKKTIKKDGIKGLFTGMGVCILRSIPVNAGSFFTYENLINYFEEEKSF